MGNSASSLPFTIGKQVAKTSDGCWEVHEGSRKSDGAAVSVFVGKKPALAKPSGPATQRKPLVGAAVHHFTHCKKLRHPHILTVEATLDTDHPADATTTGAGGGGGGGGAAAGGGAAGAAAGGGGGAATSASKAASEPGDFIIVTEPCVPFETWLQSRPDPEALAWGLEAAVRALSFIHTSAGMAHGNLSPGSFAVTPAGDVKLWNFSLVTTPDMSPHFREWEGVLTPSQYRSPERHEQRWDALAASGTGVHAVDSYGLGVLIPHIFGGVTPPPLVKAVQRMQTPNPRMRPRLQPLLKCPVFDTPYQKLQLQLEEFAVAPVESKIQFWQNLTANLQAGLVPQFLAVHKLLPIMKDSIKTTCNSDIMKSQDMYRREVAAIVQPLFYIAENYLGDSVGKELTETVATLFGVNDRGVRGCLLQKAPLLADNLDKTALNHSVFEPMCSGFNDSSSALRELTLKATLVMVPHLTPPNLEKLSRYLVRLQSDPEAAIRTNTVIFFSKLAPHLSEVTREKLLLAAFVRAMKDPFPPCRLAGLQSTLKSKEFFDPHGVSSKILPVITPQLLDSAAEVRRAAFHAVEDLLFVLRQESERMGQAEQQQQQQAQAQSHLGAGGSSHMPQANPTATAVAPAPASGGYLSGLSSWMVSSAKATSPAPAQKVAVQQPPRSAPPLATVAPAANDAIDVSDGWGDEDDGWGDDDDDDGGGGGAATAAAAPAPAPAPSTAMQTFAQPGKSDDPFASFGKPAVRPTSMGSAKGGPRGKLSVPAKKTVSPAAAAPKVAVTKLSVEDDDDGDGWDDF